MKTNVIIVALGILACGLMSFSVVENNMEMGSKNEISETVIAVHTEHNCTEEHVHSDSEGFGRCFESGCYCKEFKGRGQTCRNCGHAYKRHY